MYMYLFVLCVSS